MRKLDILTNILFTPNQSLLLNFQRATLLDDEMESSNFKAFRPRKSLRLPHTSVAEDRALKSLSVSDIQAYVLSLPA